MQRDVPSREAQDMVSEMMSLQDAFNEEAAPGWRERGFDWHRALWTECAELVERTGWKWWLEPSQPPDPGQMRLELVDIWHFGLSECLRTGRSAAAVAAALDLGRAQSLAKSGSMDDLRRAAERMAHRATAVVCHRNPGGPRFDVQEYADAMQALGMDLPMLFGMYVGKNALNLFRLRNGYRAGDYRKDWAGEEDNAVLERILQDESAGGAHGLGERVLSRLAAAYAALPPP